MSAFSHLNILCTACGKDLLMQNTGNSLKASCLNCGALFFGGEGYIDLLPETHYKRSFAQKMMEWPRLIKLYESKLWRRSPYAAFSFGILFDKELELVTEAMGLNGREILLDLACGTGIYTRPFSRILSEGLAVGLDLSLPMLSWAGTKANEEGIKNILYVRASALNIPFPNSSFDRVNCCGALHLFPVTKDALTEITRVLKKDGMLTIAAYRNWLPGKTSDRIVRWSHREIGVRYFRQQELEILFREVGLTKVQCHWSRRYWLIMSGNKA